MSTLRAYTPPAAIPEITAPASSFAYRPIDIADRADRDYLESVASMSRSSAGLSWRYYDTVGEVHYAISRSSRLAGYGQFYAERINTRGQAIDSKDQGVVADIVAGIYGRFGGVRGLIERYYTLMKIPAEGYLIRVREGGDVDGYWVLSPDEIEPASLVGGRPKLGEPVKWITASIPSTGGGNTNFTREVRPEDFIGRIWNPSKRYVDMVDSAMYAQHQLCEELVMLTDNIKGRLQQRFALAGLLLIPSEINDAQIAGPTPGEVHSDKVMNYLITIMTRNVMNHEHALAHIPAILKGPAEVLDKVRHVVMETLVHETEIAQRQELIGRILDGLEVSKSQSKDGEDQSHWGRWEASNDEIRVAVRPDLEAFCHTLTRAVLHAELKARNWEPGRIRGWRVGLDLTDAVSKTNQGEDFRLAFDRVWVSAEAGRKVIGAKPEDAPDEKEQIRIIGWKQGDPYLALYGLKEAENIDWDKVGKGSSSTGPDPDSPADGGKVGPGVGDPGSPNDRDSDEKRSDRPG